MPFELDLDLSPANDQTIEEMDLNVRERIARHNGTVKEYTPNGPAGGNPNYKVEVPDRATAKELYENLYPGSETGEDCDTFEDRYPES